MTGVQTCALPISRLLLHPVLPEPTPPGSIPSELESDDFYVPKTPSPRSPSKEDLDSSHGFFNPNPGPPNPLRDSKIIDYGNPDGSPSKI